MGGSRERSYLILGKLGIVHVLKAVWSATGASKARRQSLTTNLIPMLLDTPFGARGECLWTFSQQSPHVQHATRTSREDAKRTFAISAQELPLSLICFRRSSSAGVHGVFVRLFFAGGPLGVVVESSAAAGWAGVVAAAVAGVGAAAVPGTDTGVGVAGTGTGGGMAVAGAGGGAAAAGFCRLRDRGWGAGAGVGVGCWGAAAAGWGGACCCCWTC